jgi:ribose transport system substrate-binding protein
MVGSGESRKEWWGMVKVAWRLLIVVMAALVIAGCGTVSQQPQQQQEGGGDQAQEQGGEQQGSEEQAGGEEQGDAADLAMVTINTQAVFFTQMIDGAEKAAKDSGASLAVFNANNDAAAQNTAIENFIGQGVDGLIVVAIDVEGIKPAVQQAEEANIPVVAVDAVVEDPAVDIQVGVDNEEAGRQIGEFFNEYAREEGVDSAEVGIIGALNSFIQIQRQDSFIAAIQEGGHTAGQVVDGQNVQETAQGASEDLFTANPDLEFAYATGEPAMIGAVAAVRSQNVTDRVSLFGWDLSESVIGGIDDGFVKGVVQQDPYTEGAEAVNAAIALNNDEEVEKTIDVPITIVTQENVDEYRELFE